MKDSKSGKVKSPADWEEVRRRVAAVNKALEQGTTPDPAETRKILRQRAEQLAREAWKAPSGETIEVLEFTLAYERYGLETAYVREVFPLKDLTPVPCT